MVKRDVLDRYEQAASGGYIIDVAAVNVEALYDDFDRSAPYVRRDLNQDLVDFLIDSARDLAGVRFCICFTLDEPPAHDKLLRVERSVNRFFRYLAEIERTTVRAMIRKSLVLLAIGAGILSLAVWVNLLVEPRSVPGRVLAEGLTVAAWVSLWEALAIFLIEWFPRRRDIVLYQRLAATELRFRPRQGAGGAWPEPGAEAAQP